MANTRWETSPDDIKIHNWIHRDEADSPDFDGDFYAFQPRGGILASSRWDSELTHNAAYPALGSPNHDLQLRPSIGQHLGFAFDMFVEAASTGKIKFVLKVGANREQLDLRDSSGSIVSELSTTVLRSAVDADRTAGLIRAASEDLRLLGTLGDMESEDAELEIYLENTTDTVVVRNMRIYMGMSTYVEDGTVNGDYLR